MGAHELVQANRTWITNTLRGLDDAGWTATTLCEGWDAEDLAAHLVARERRPSAGPGIIVPALAGLHTRAMQKEKARGREQLVARLEAGPPLSFLWDLVNVVEFWIHAEDLARGSLALTRPAPTGEMAGRLWKAVGQSGRLNLRRVRHKGVLAVVDTESGRATAFSLGSPLVRRADPDGADVTLRGKVGELVLYLSGRREAADVELTPPQHPLATEVGTVELGI